MALVKPQKGSLPSSVGRIVVSTPPGMHLETALPEASSLGTQGFFQRCAQIAAYKAHRTRVSASWSIHPNVLKRMDHRA